MAIVVPGGGGGGGGGTTLPSNINAKTVVADAITASVILSAEGSANFASGLNASGLVAVPSGFFASGLEASALIKGTIGQFLATAIAGSGLNASGQVQAPSILSESGIDTSAAILVGDKVSAAGSGIFMSGVSAPDIEVSTINGVSPVIGPSGDFPSGGTLSALVSAAASIHVGSGVNVSGPVQASSVSALTGTLSTLTACALLSVGGSAIFNSGVDLSGPVLGTSGVFQSGLDSSALVKVGTSVLVSGDANVSQATVRGALSVVGSAAIGSALSVLGSVRISGPVTIASSLEASGGLSVGGSGTFASGLNTSAFTAFGAAVSINGSMIVESNLYTSGSAVAGSGFFTSGDVVAGGSAVVASAVYTSGAVVAGGSVVAASAFTTSGDVIVGGSLTTTSGLFTSGQAQFLAPSTIVDILMLMATGQTSANFVISGVAGGAGLVYQIDASGNVFNLGKISVGGSGVFVSGFNASALAALLDLTTSTETVATLLSVGGSVLGQSGATFSGPVSATSFIGAFTFQSVNTQSGGTWSAVLNQGASVLIGCTLGVSGITSLGGSLLVDSAISTSTIIAGGGAISAATSLGATSGLDISGVFVILPTSTVASAGGAYISIGSPTGLQASYLFRVSYASPLLALNTSGALSIPGAITLASTVSAQGAVNSSGAITTASTISAAVAHIGGASLLVQIQASVLTGSSGGMLFQFDGAGCAAITGTLSTFGLVVGTSAQFNRVSVTASMQVNGQYDSYASVAHHSITYFIGGTRYLAFTSIQNGQVLAASVALLDYILVGSNATSILLPSAAGVSGKNLTILTSAGASAIFSVIAATGDNIEGVSGVTQSGAPSFAKMEFYTPGSVTWYLLTSTAELI